MMVQVPFFIPENTRYQTESEIKVTQFIGLKKGPSNYLTSLDGITRETNFRW